MTIELRKVTDDSFTDEMGEQIEQRAMKMLGKKFGTLKRVGECTLRCKNHRYVFERLRESRPVLFDFSKEWHVRSGVVAVNAKS